MNLDNTQMTLNINLDNTQMTLNEAERARKCTSNQSNKSYKVAQHPLQRQNSFCKSAIICRAHIFKKRDSTKCNMRTVVLS